jgi:hypothetical protein
MASRANELKSTLQNEIKNADESLAEFDAKVAEA